jgi:hypothetical protein
VSDPFDNEQFREVLGEWLYEVEMDDSAIALDDLAGRLEVAELPPEWAKLVKRGTLISPDAVRNWLLLPAGDWTWASTLRAEQVTVIDARGAIRTTTFNELRADPRFLVGMEATALVFDVGLAADRLPFRFDGRRWSHTECDEAFGETEWVIRINGEESPFDLDQVELYFEPGERAAEGNWLTVSEDGVSMSTGDIGVSVWVTDDGALFSHIWGSKTTCHGFAPADLTIDQVIELIDPEDCGLSSIAGISSEIVGIDEMRDVVTKVLAKALNDVELDEIEVICADWEGTAAELLDEESNDD